MKERTIAILLCFFLGGFGIHKFYLGNNAQGVVYLIFSWTLIPGIIAFFEFFGLCFMSDREFDARFNNYALPTLLDRSSGYPIVPPAKSKKRQPLRYTISKSYMKMGLSLLKSTKSNAKKC
jgi:TM2 domain-containing membrane protein YozV